MPCCCVENYSCRCSINPIVVAFLIDFFMKTPEFIWLHCKNKHKLVFYFIPYKVAGPGVFAGMLNHTCCYHGNHWCNLPICLPGCTSFWFTTGTPRSLAYLLIHLLLLQLGISNISESDFQQSASLNVLYSVVLVCRWRASVLETDVVRPKDWLIPSRAEV